MNDHDLIDWREREGIAWAIRDMLLNASRDTDPSNAAKALLAIMRDQAPQGVRQAIDKHGFAIFNQLLPEREAIAETLKTMSEDLARAWITDLGGKIKPSGGVFCESLPRLAKIAQGLSMGLKTTLAEKLKKAIL